MKRGTDIGEAARVLRDGGLVVYPTETLYGLGCDPFRDGSVERVFDVKSRPRDRSLPVAFGALSEARPFVKVTPLAKRLSSALLPGPLTLVLELTPEGVDKMGAVTTSGTLAVRVPEGPLIQGLLERFGPVTATSANTSGGRDPRTPGEVEVLLKDLVDYYLLDAAPVPGRSSTIVDARGEAPRVLREGPISAAALAEVAPGA